MSEPSSMETSSIGDEEYEALTKEGYDVTMYNVSEYNDLPLSDSFDEAEGLNAFCLHLRTKMKERINSPYGILNLQTNLLPGGY